MSNKRVFFRLIFYPTLLYVVMCLYLYFKEDSYVFFPVKSQYVQGATPFAREITFKPGLHGWLVNPENASDTLIVFYGGNGEDLYDMLPQFNAYLKSSVLAINYRGYGRSLGNPTQNNLFNDAINVLEKVRADYNPKKVILFGHSLGSGVAIYVSSKKMVDGLILSAPFDSLAKITSKRFPWLPNSLLLRHRFDSIDYAPEVNAKTLFLCAEKDKAIPLEDSRRLESAFTNSTNVKIIKGANHNNMSLNPEYWKIINGFVSSL